VWCLRQSQDSETRDGGAENDEHKVDGHEIDGHENVRDNRNTGP